MEDRRGSRARRMLAIAVLGVLATVALIAPVGAALNKNKVKKIVNKTAYSKAAADGRFINSGEKAADSELLDGVDSAGFVQPQGLIHVSIGPNEWVARIPASTVTTEHLANGTFFTGPEKDNQFLGVHPAIPIAMFGRSVQLLGVEFCYDTVSNTTIDQVFLSAFENSTTATAGPDLLNVTDATDHTDAACLLYSAPTPFTLTGDHYVNFTARVDYGVGGGDLTIGRTTFVLANTNTAAAVLARQGAVTMAPTGPGPGTGAAKP